MGSLKVLYCFLGVFGFAGLCYSLAVLFEKYTKKCLKSSEKTDSRIAVLLACSREIERRKKCGDLK